MGVCEPWLTPNDVCGSDPVPPAVARLAIASAQAWLFDATCGQFTGVCRTVIRPVLRDRDVEWCLDRADSTRLDLSPWVTGPVRSIETVIVDGVVVPDTDYRLVNNRWLVAHNDGALRPWPDQHIDVPDGEPDTWSVAVTHGRVAPPHVLDAAADLARQLIAKATGGDCMLPDNATSISRDGVQVELNVPSDGKTGLPLVDTVVAMYPCRRSRRMWDPATPDAEVWTPQPMG